MCHKVSAVEPSLSGLPQSNSPQRVSLCSFSEKVNYPVTGLFSLEHRDIVENSGRDKVSKRLEGLSLFGPSKAYRGASRMLCCACPEIMSCITKELEIGHSKSPITHKMVFLEAVKILQLMFKQYQKELQGELKGERFFNQVRMEEISLPIDVSKALQIYSFLNDYNLLALRSWVWDYIPKYKNPTIEHLHEEADAFRTYLENNAINTSHIDLQFSKMALLPSEIRFFTNVQEIILSHNPIRFVSPEIRKLEKLQGFFLNCSELRTFSPDIFGHEVEFEVTGPNYSPLNPLI